jgi:osmoprotectant transport system ATP-binding protein
MSAALEFRSISYRVDGRDILRGIDLCVKQGETVVLLGRSGSGKTTLLRTVNRMIRPTDGEVLFGGKPVSEWDPIRLRRQTGYVIQDGGLFPHATVEANIGLVPKLEGWPPERIGRRVDELMDAMGLPREYRSRYPRQLSGGEKQRVGIARALAADPPLLLFDEPFAALDPVTRFEMQQQFIALRRTLRKTTLFVTHDIREALTLGSRIAVLHAGRLELVASPREFLDANTPEASAFRATIAEDWRPDESHACE